MAKLPNQLDLPIADKPVPRPRVSLSFDPEDRHTKSRTHQSFKNECNINSIMARYNKTGVINHVNATQGQYGDFSEATDYQTALNQVIEAQNSFMLLPAKLRSRFENDPAQFLDFVNDPNNYNEMIDLGLLTKPSVTDSHISPDQLNNKAGSES